MQILCNKHTNICGTQVKMQLKGLRGRGITKISGLVYTRHNSGSSIRGPVEVGLNHTQVKKQLKGLEGKAAAKEADRRTRRLGLRAERLQQKLEAAREALDEQLSNGWRTFESLRDVLVQAGACCAETLAEIQEAGRCTHRARRAGAPLRACATCLSKPVSGF